jgi:hypothetical protein
MLLWQRMAPPHNGRSITCDLCGAGPSLAKDFFSILLRNNPQEFLRLTGWRKISMIETRALLLSCAVTLASSAYAQTWVSASVGSDSNTCTRSAPCKTFARAVSETPAWGQVSVLDPGDYGSVTITQPMTIDGGGLASNVATTGTAITVSAASGAVVQLRNLSLHGDGASAGINFTGGGQLVVEHVKINGFGGWCMNVGLTGSGASDVVIKDTSIDNCSTGGISMYASGPLTAEITNTHVHYANQGLSPSNGYITVSGSSFSSPTIGGSGSGIITSTAGFGTPPIIMVDNCEISGWGTGVLVNSGGTVQLSRSTLSNNSTALFASGALISNGNNSFLNNSTMGAFTRTVALQ